MNLFRRRNTADAGKRPQTTRLRIFAWAFGICLGIGVISLALPLEDLFRGLRNYVRTRPADGSVVVVAVDEQAFDKLGGLNYSRSYDARLIDQLFVLGANRIYFDRTFSKPTDPKSDGDLIAALKRHPGKIAMGFSTYIGTRDHKTGVKRPTPIFRPFVNERSISAVQTPLMLSAVAIPYEIDGNRKIPAVGIDISGVPYNSSTYLRPDWTIDQTTVPTFSMLDVLTGKIPAQSLHGKDVLIGDTAPDARDFVQVLGRGWFPGVYAHAISAQTLREGPPRDMGPYLPLAIASVLSLLLLWAKDRRRARMTIFAAIPLAVFLPFVLDSFLIYADYFPAYLMFGIVAFRSASLRSITEARQQNAGTMLPNLSALREVKTVGNQPLIAMRIRNYAAVCASFSDPVEDALVMEVTRRLKVPGRAPTFYQAEDVLYWMGPVLSRDELEGHIAGLARLIESQFIVRGRKIDLQVAFGVDEEFGKPNVNRIGRALLAADKAAEQQRLCAFASDAVGADSEWELSLMSELDAAIDAGDIWIAYQPQFDLKTDRICGAEALVRWQHPVRGAISPEAFILPAEAHNRVQRLTFHVLEKAARATLPLLRTWPQFRLSVNISAKLLEQPQVPAQIADVLIQTGFPASNLTLEVTESAPFKEHEAVRANLSGIAAIGIDLSIDDYGTGNATLEYLRSVPCQEIKIDRRFVSGLTTTRSDMLLVESTIELAHGLDRRVIAEGIEDPETLELLRVIGCDIAQGFYLSRPIPIDALFELLNGKRSRRAA